MALVIYTIRGITDPDLRGQWKDDLVAKTAANNPCWINVAAQFVKYTDQDVSEDFDAIHKK